MTSKRFGQILVILGFIAMAFTASLDPETLDWRYFLYAAAFGFIGAVFVKRAEKAAAEHSVGLKVSREALDGSLANVLAELKELDGRRDQIPTYDMRFEIDRRVRTDLLTFAENRDAMKTLFGLEAFADIMSSFAAGERYVNRVWSASTDGYVDEVLVYIEKAHRQFEHARSEFDRAVAERL